MLLSQLPPPLPLAEAPSDPARLADEVARLVWRERELDAVARAARVEIAAQAAEVAEWRARVAAQAAELDRLRQTVETQAAALAQKDHQVRRLRREMRAVQDYVRTSHLPDEPRPDRFRKTVRSARLVEWLRGVVRRRERS